VTDLQFHGWQDSPLIRAAMREGRRPDDICIVSCDRCGSVVYYNQGSHCACEWCEANLDHLIDPDAGQVLTLADHLDALADEDELDWP
jgi:hypothetical protein